MRAIPLLLLHTFAKGFIPGHFRRGSIIHTLKIQEPIVVDRWEDGEVSWTFNETELHGNTTSVFRKPDDPLSPVGIKNGKFIYEIN
jgi:hypothetical protein